jgi:hypothetical protein
MAGYSTSGRGSRVALLLGGVFLLAALLLVRSAGQVAGLLIHGSWPHVAIPWFAATYRDVSALVTWLREQGRKVPAFWYVHPWAVGRLLLLLHWRSAVPSSNWNLEEWP